MKFLKISIILVLLSIGGVLGADYWIHHNAKTHVFTSLDKIPKNRVGLLLGTSKYVSKGRINLYYAYRINAAVALFEAGKIDYILVSGDNGSRYYDEPTTFKKDLIARGIPEDCIILDFAGFRTLDSVVRAQKIFGQHNITIISQKFHNERAIYLAQHFNMNAIAYNAKDVGKRYGLKIKAREYVARLKAIFDVVFNVQPKYLGEKIKI